MRPSTYPVRVSIISPSHTVRAGVVNLIAQLNDRAVVTDTESVVPDATTDRHDVVIYDLGAIADDLTAVRDLRRLVAGDIQVVGLLYDQACRSRPAGAGDSTQFVTLAVTPEHLMFVLDECMSRILRSTTVLGVGDRSLPAELTEQEFRVMELIGAGLTNGAIAKELYVSINTVKTYIRTAYRKVRVTGRSAAMLWAFDHGLAGGPDRR